MKNKVMRDQVIVRVRTFSPSCACTNYLSGAGRFSRKMLKRSLRLRSCAFLSASLNAELQASRRGPQIDAQGRKEEDSYRRSVAELRQALPGLVRGSLSFIAASGLFNTMMRHTEQSDV